MKPRGKERKIGRIILVVVFLFVFLFATLSTVMAAYFGGAIPDGKIVENKYRLWSAGALGVDNAGNLYVVDSIRNHILKYSASGAFLGDIKVKQPSAIAVSDDGTIYVGSNRNYSVAIIKNDKIVGYLGAGPGEFKSVKDLAYDSLTSEVYVVDNVDGRVKIYASDGKYLRSITGLHLPIAIAIKNNEVYILDTPIAIVTDGQGEEVTTSGRIMVFDKDGNNIRSFDSPDNPDTNMVTPTDIEVDDVGHVFVTDSAKKGVHVYDNSGNYLGLLIDDNDPITLARAVTEYNGKLFVSLSEGHCIRIFKLNNTLSMQNRSTIQTGASNTRMISIGDKKGNSMTNSVSINSNSGSGTVVESNLIVASDMINIIGLTGSVISRFQPFADTIGNVDVEYADFDGDGTGEIAAALRGDTTSKIGLFSVNGNMINSFSTNSSVVGMASADIDGDGISDLIVSTGSSIDIYGINSDSIVLKDEIATGADVIAAGDVDGDGLVDMVVYDKASGDLKILDLSGNVKQSQTLGVVPVAIKVADLNNSGVESVIVATADGVVFSTDGSMQIKVNSNISDIAVKDVNGDGANEVVIALNDGTVKIVSLNGTALADISTGMQADVNITTGQIGY